MKTRICLVLLLTCLLAAPIFGQEYTQSFDRDGCTFTTTGENPYFPLWPGYALVLEGEEEDDEGELVEISTTNTVLADTERVDGVLTRVLEERELEDGELVEISRNFVAICRETGDVWYFGEDVDDYEDGMIVGHEGAWRAGVNGATPGIVFPGTPFIGARYYEEFAPGVAEDRGEIVAMGEEITVPAGIFDRTIQTIGTSPLSPDEMDEKAYAHGVGLIQDEELELVEIVEPACRGDEEKHCLSNGRFAVEVEWRDFEGLEGDGQAILPSSDSGEFYFFSPNNTELLVKVLDACDSAFNSFWVFAAGLTNIELTLTVTDTQTQEVKVYTNPLGADFQPVLDTGAFNTCP